MEQALSAPVPKKARDLAHKALQADPHSMEAMSLLASLTKSPAESEYWLQRALLSGEAQLAELLNSGEDSLWDHLEARPYLTAKEELATLYVSIGRRGAAVELYQDILKANRDDNQGVRFYLMAELLADWRDREAWALYRQYEDEGSCVWHWARALLEFRALRRLHPWDSTGEMEHLGEKPLSIPPALAAARPYLESALQSNPYLGLYLIFPHIIPDEEPESYQFGEQSEADVYADGVLPPWWISPESVLWAMPIVIEWMNDNGYEELLASVPPPPEDWDMEDDDDNWDEDDQPPLKV